MYRKQVRRRRAVLALLIIGSFVLLTITYGQGSGGLQRGVSTIFSPLQTVADRALKPARDLIDWFDKTFDARGRKQPPQGRTGDRARAGGRAARRRCRRTRSCASWSSSTRRGARRLGLRAGHRPGDRPLADGLELAVTIDVGSGDGVEVDDPVISGDGLVGPVSSVEGGSAQVTLITDHSSAVSAKVLPERRPGRDPARRRRPRGPDPRLHRLDQARRTTARRSSPPAGARRASPRASRRTCRSAKSPRPRSSSRRPSQQVRLRPYADLANLDLVQVLTGGSRG